MTWRFVLGWCSSLCSACACAAPAASLPAPAHGTTIVEIAQDGNHLRVAFDLSGLDAVGFERAPRSDAERTHVIGVLGALQAPDDWLVPNAEARCRRFFSGVTPHVFKSIEEHAAEPVDKHGRRDEPTWIGVQYEFACEAPEQLRAIDFNLIERFPRLRGIIVNLTLPGGRSQAVLTTARASIAAGR